MNVWLVKAHENIPVNDTIVLSRMGQIAEWFSKRGHSVTWWATTFQHFSKKNIANSDTDIAVNDNYLIKCFFSKWVYKKNISLARIFHNLIIAYRINKQINHVRKPDLIVCAYPTY
jgi:hypothetical protein